MHTRVLPRQNDVSHTVNGLRFLHEAPRPIGRGGGFVVHSRPPSDTPYLGTYYSHKRWMHSVSVVLEILLAQTRCRPTDKLSINGDPHSRPFPRMTHISVPVLHLSLQFDCCSLAIVRCTDGSPIVKAQKGALRATWRD